MPIERLRQGRAWLSAGIGALTSAAALAQPVLGDLPAGALAGFEVSDVRAEVCRTLFFPANAMPVVMPAGYRLSKLSERKNVPAVAEMLGKRPELADYAKGTLCFIDAGIHTVDGRALYRGRRSRTAFLWADMVPADGVVADCRQLGTRRRVQLFWIYDERGIDVGLARKAIPDALFGTIDMEKTGDGWSVSLSTKDGKLTARAVPASPRVPLKHPLPAFETVPLAGAGRDRFFVLTYAGHHDRKAAAEWRASGSDPWVRTVASAVTGADADFIQDSFTVRLNLYEAASHHDCTPPAN